MDTASLARLLGAEERGRGDDLVVFVHGVLDRGRSFSRVAALLEDECRMLWYDRRGYGSSVDPHRPALDVDGHAEDLLGVLDGRRAVVVGHSFGGVTVLAAALRAPGLVRSVVLYETGMAWVPGWDDTRMRALLWGEDPDVAGVRMMFGDRWDAMTEENRSRRLLEARAFVVEERSVRLGPPPFDLAALPVPLVYGWGGTPPFDTVAAHLRDTVSDVEIVTIPEGGHNAHRSRPEEFADLVRRGMSRPA